MEKRIFLFLYNLSVKHKYLRRFSIFVSEFSSRFVKGLYLISVVYFVAFKNLSLFKLALYLLIPFLTLKFNTYLRKVIKRKRPFVQDKSIVPFIKHSTSYSCPSNHSVSSMVICLGTIILSENYYFLIAIPILTGVSRVMTGIHYPLDVVLGWLIGMVFSIFFLLPN